MYHADQTHRKGSPCSQAGFPLDSRALGERNTEQNLSQREIQTVESQSARENTDHESQETFQNISYWLNGRLVKERHSLGESNLFFWQTRTHRIKRHHSCYTENRMRLLVPVGYLKMYIRRPELPLARQFKLPLAFISITSWGKE